MASNSSSESKSTNSRMARSFNYVCSRKDEIVLLEGLKSFREEHGMNVDWSQFHHYIKGKLEANHLSKRQVYEKIRRLRNKYIKKVTRGKKSSPRNDHEALLLELSESLWGKDIINVTGKKRDKMKNETRVDSEDEEHEQQFRKKWIQICELEVKKLDRMIEVQRMVLEQMKKNYDM